MTYHSISPLVKNHRQQLRDVTRTPEDQRDHAWAMELHAAQFRLSMDTYTARPSPSYVRRHVIPLIAKGRTALAEYGASAKAMASNVRLRNLKLYCLGLSIGLLEGI